jgi:hypothetical protein
MRRRESNLGDGPIQRQIILVRLVHEVENRPNFGTQYNNDPDGDVRKWIARVGALMARVGIVEGVNFQSEVGMLARNWENSIRSMILSVMNTIEQIKLEFDLYPGDSIGEVYKEGDIYSFFSDLAKIISAAERTVLIVDRLCCTKRVRDSCRESSVVAGLHEQTYISDLQNHELG